jgi:signal transduction histidine kinase
MSMSDASATERPQPRLTPEDLASLMNSFNAVTSKLEATHESLRAEVARLNRELSEANAALERSRRLAALGEMAAGIAHEVRNPLGGIRLYARLLEQDLEQQPKQRELALKIENAAKSLDQIVGDVLTFSKEFKLRIESCDAADLIQRALEACMHDGVPGWDRVKVEGVESLEGVRVDADAHLIGQALTNIVRNAIESMAQVGGEGHKLVFAGGRRRVLGQTGREQFASFVRITDTGTGIPPEVVQRMFNPFFTTRAAGTGLGLSIVHRIAEAHGGRVSLKNREDGRGAVAEIVLPEIAESGADRSIQTGSTAAEPRHTEAR